MSANDPGARPPIAVAVWDEPDLVVSGVGGMLAAHQGRAMVTTLGGNGTAGVDVLLCDPVGRATPIEDYLVEVSGITGAAVVAFSWNDRSSTVRRALAAGARGFVSKKVSAADLVDALEAVRRGETVVRPVLSPTDDGLSVREAEVLELICRGLSNLEIAEALYVSVNSVKTYVRQIYGKIKVARRSQAVAWGIARGY